jgi:hypothetical protein
MPRLRICCTMAGPRPVPRPGIPESTGRNVDEENPSPSPGVGDVAAERRPQRRSNDRGERRDPERSTSPGRWKGIKDDRLLARLEAPSEEALEEPEDDEFREAGRDAAQQRANREHGDADQEISLRPNPSLSQPEIVSTVPLETRRQYRGGFVVRRRETAGTMWQCHIDDRGIENCHEGGERHHDCNEPRIVARSPARGGWNGVICRRGPSPSGPPKSPAALECPVRGRGR